MRAAGVILVCLALAGCGKGLASFALGSALPDVAANVQAGRTNVQAVGVTDMTDQRLIRPQARNIEQSAGETGVRAEAVDSVTVQNGPPPWVVLLLVLGWLAPSPGEIARYLRGLMGWGR